MDATTFNIGICEMSADLFVQKMARLLKKVMIQKIL